VVEKFIDLVEDVMYWYEPSKVMYKERKEILKRYSAKCIPSW
jgi:hypothetical protein